LEGGRPRNRIDSAAHRTSRWSFPRRVYPPAETTLARLRAGEPDSRGNPPVTACDRLDLAVQLADLAQRVEAATCFRRGVPASTPVTWPSYTAGLPATSTCRTPADGRYGSS